MNNVFVVNFCQVDLLDQQPHFKVSSYGALLKSALEIDVDLVEWALKVLMSIPAFFRIFFNQPEKVEDTTGLYGLTKVCKNWERCSPDLQSSVREIYSSNILTTQRLGSFVYAWLLDIRMLVELYRFSNSCTIYENKTYKTCYSLP